MNCPQLFNASANLYTPPYYAPFPEGPFPQYVGVDQKNMFHAIFTRNLLGCDTIAFCSLIATSIPCFST